MDSCSEYLRWGMKLICGNATLPSPLPGIASVFVQLVYVKHIFKEILHHIYISLKISYISLWTLCLQDFYKETGRVWLIMPKFLIILRWFFLPAGYFLLTFVFFVFVFCSFLLFWLFCIVVFVVFFLIENYFRTHNIWTGLDRGGPIFENDCPQIYINTNESILSGLWNLQYHEYRHLPSTLCCSAILDHPPFRGNTVNVLF